MMSEESIVIIQHNRLKKYNYCTYGAYLTNWGKYNWKLLYKVIKKNKDEVLKKG
tara:strand:+ start:5476 stop:5637 length:162 start_codon:yes stop_codon:yes gene_type:complete